MLPFSHQPAHLFATAKTHKFKNIDNITIDNLKLRPIIDQIGTYNKESYSRVFKTIFKTKK